MSKINWKQVGGGLVAGALAGVAGSVALSLTDTIVDRYLGDEQTEKTSASDQATHFGYGAVAGAIRGAVLGLGFTGIPGKLLYWGTTALSARTLLPAMGLSPRLEQKKRGLPANVAHHLIYAVVSVVVLGLVKRFTPFDPGENA